MYTHSEIWAVLDKIAEKNRLSISGLAKRAGLDATSFNKSKRVTGNGRPRWPSTESVAKVLSNSDTSVEEFAALLLGRNPDEGVSARIPMVDLEEASAGGFFDDAGFPVVDNWRDVAFPSLTDRYAYGLQVTGDSLAPVCRDGDIIVMSPDSPVRDGDRVVARTHHGELLVMVLQSQSASGIELAPITAGSGTRVFEPRDIDWMARIVWIKQ